MSERRGGGPEPREMQECEHGNRRSDCLLCRRKGKQARTADIPENEAPPEPKEPLQLVAKETEKLTLDERRKELPMMRTKQALEENWEIEREAQEAKSSDRLKGALNNENLGALTTRRDFFKGLFGVEKEPSQKAKDVMEELYENWIDDVEYNQETTIGQYLVELLQKMKKILPELETGFFVERMQEINGRIEKVLASRKAGKPLDEKTLVEVNMLANEPMLLKEMFRDAVKEEAKRKFAPLVARVRGDVRMFLMKHVHGVGLEPKEAARFLAEKADRRPDIVFLPEMEKEETEKDGRSRILLGLYDGDTITINLERLPFLKSGAVDEAQLAETLTHEQVHAVSTVSKKGMLGLQEYKDLFSGVVRGQDIHSPEEFLNELATELLALEITSKYYRPDAPGTIKVHAPEKQEFVGYADMVEAFVSLEKSYGDKVRELKDLLVGVMVRGDYGKLLDYFLANKKLYEEVRDICAGSAARASGKAPPEH